LRDYITYTCNNPRGHDSSCGTSSSPVLIQTCLQNQLCSNALCMNVTCLSDNECNDNNQYTFDKCENPGTLQSFCNYTEIKCLYDGDSKCDDNNISTEDHCINPNTTASYCNHLNISCFNNLDCGNSSYINLPFCGESNNILRDYITYTCNNPGQQNSNCSISNSVKQLENCTSAQFCLGGICQNNTENNTENNENNIQEHHEHGYFIQNIDEFQENQTEVNSRTQNSENIILINDNVKITKNLNSLNEKKSEGFGETGFIALIITIIVLIALLLIIILFIIIKNR